MFHEYQNEIIILAVILILTLVYIIVKKTRPSINEENESFKEEELKIINLDITPKTTPKVDKKETPPRLYDKDLNGTEEGDFGEQEGELTGEPQTKSKSIVKRNVISHGKITKQNFTEFSGERILVAEDNLINQKVITGLLAGSGIDVIIVNDGQEVLDILQRDTDFLMILMDAHMPRVDGFEATREIRKNVNYDHIVVVALSGDTAADDLRKMRDAGMAEQLEKPLRMDSLYDVFYAYSGQEKVSSDNEYVEVIMTKELNGDKGLEICGGDEAFYNEILDEFVKSYENSTKQLGNLLVNDQIQEASALLLDVIGVTANIGAQPLHEIANEIKSSLSDTEEKSYLTLVDEYKLRLENLLRDIKAYR